MYKYTACTIQYMYILDYPNCTAAQFFSKFHSDSTLISDEAALPSPQSIIVSQEAHGVDFLDRVSLS